MPLDISDANLIDRNFESVIEKQKEIIRIGEEILKEIRRRNDLEEQRQKNEFSR